MSRFIFYVANTQADNMGDLVINKLLMNELSKRGELNVNVRKCSSNYIKMIESIGSKNTEKSYFLYVIDMVLLSLKGKDVEFYLKPGHFYGNDGGVVKKCITLFCYVLMKLAGINIFRFGASIGPFKPLPKMIEKLQSKFFETYTAREEISLEYAKNMGIKNPAYCPDMAFLLGYNESIEIAGKRSVILSFREKTLADDAKSLDLISTLNDAVSYFENQEIIAVSQVTSDKYYNQNLLEQLSVNTRHAIFDDTDDGAELFNIYSDAEFVLSNRLHVLLFAASKGAIPIPVIEKDKHIKITGIFNASGLSDVIYDLKKGDDIRKHLSYIVENKDDILNRLSFAFDSQKSKILKLLEK